MTLFARLFLVASALILVPLTACVAADTPHSTIEDIRAWDAGKGGFQWRPLKDTPQIQAYLKQRDGELYEMVMGELANVDVAVRDLDLDKKNDIVLYLHSMSFCGTIGCTFYVIPGDGRKKIFEFGAHGADPIRRGIKGDGNPYYF